MPRWDMWNLILFILTHYEESHYKQFKGMDQNQRPGKPQILI